MKVVLIAPVPEPERAKIAAVDTRLDVHDAWELFGPELVADWPVHTAEWYLPKRFQALKDSDDLRARRSALLACAEVVCITFPPPNRIAARAPNLRFGFAADVYEGEFDHGPPAELLAFDNVLLTPHTSGHTEHPPTGPLDIFRENLRRCLAGEPLVNQVSWDRGY